VWAKHGPAALKSNGAFAHGGMVARARCPIRHVGLGSRLLPPRFSLHGRVVGRTYCRKIFAFTLSNVIFSDRESLSCPNCFGFWLLDC
jgi:hypothetical protein